MTPSRNDDSRLKRGTRRLHLASGEVWRVLVEAAPSLTNDWRMIIVREKDGTERSVAEDYWLGDSWGRPRTRAGCR